MERFNNKDSWVAMGRHELSAPVHALDDASKAAFRLNSDDLHAVTLEGKVRTCIFEQWHGGHCLFYSPKDDWRMLVWHETLRKVVKRKRS